MLLISHAVVLIESSLEKELERLGEDRLIRDEEIIPSSYPDFPKEAKWLPPFAFEKAPRSPEEIPPYSDLWAQFMNERYQGLYEMMGVINDRNVDRRRGPHVVGVAFENAFYHGNQNNPDLAVRVRMFEGAKGALIRIKDAGKGFDYKKKTRQVREAGERQLNVYSKPDSLPAELKYFSRKGGGFYAYYIDYCRIFFEEKGSAIGIVFEDRIDLAENLRLQREG